MYFIHPFGFINYDALPPILFFTGMFIIFISYGKEERCGVQFNSSRHGNLYEDKAIDKKVPTWELTSFPRCAFKAIYTCSCCPSSPARPPLYTFVVWSTAQAVLLSLIYFGKRSGVRKRCFSPLLQHERMTPRTLSFYFVSFFILFWKLPFFFQIEKFSCVPSSAFSFLVVVGLNSSRQHWQFTGLHSIASAGIQPMPDISHFPVKQHVATAEWGARLHRIFRYIFFLRPFSPSSYLL